VFFKKFDFNPDMKMDPEPEPGPKLSEKSDPEPDPDPEIIFSAPTHCSLGLRFYPVLIDKTRTSFLPKPRLIPPFLTDFADVFTQTLNENEQKINKNTHQNLLEMCELG